jgi:hypothetical protein
VYIGPVYMYNSRLAVAETALTMALHEAAAVDDGGGRARKPKRREGVSSRRGSQKKNAVQPLVGSPPPSNQQAAAEPDGASASPEAAKLDATNLRDPAVSDGTFLDDASCT